MANEESIFCKLKGELFLNVKTKILNGNNSLEQIHHFYNFITKSNIKNQEVLTIFFTQDLVTLKETTRKNILSKIDSLVSTASNEDLKTLNSYFESNNDVEVLKDKINKLENENNVLNNNVVEVLKDKINKLEDKINKLEDKINNLEEELRTLDQLK
jgi:predicted nuclease with TOPRIM domain